MTSHPNHLQDSGALYLVFCGLYDPPYTPERYARDMTWAGTVKDISDRQFPSLRQVIEVGTGRDVTEEMIAEVSDAWAIQGDPLSDKQHKFLEEHTSVEFANRFAREDA